MRHAPEVERVTSFSTTPGYSRFAKWMISCSCGGWSGGPYDWSQTARAAHRDHVRRAKARAAVR